MACYGCTKKFTLLNTEHGCPGCGFAYCKKCLNNKIYIEKYNKLKKCCLKCKKMADDPSKKIDPSNIEPPKAYLRRIESLDNPSKPPITLYQANTRMQRLKRGLSEADCEIAERLEKLRDDRKKDTLPSDQEIKERLAKLRDEPMASSTKSNLPKADFRSDQQKADDLLKQYMEECEITENSSKVDKEKDRNIKQRLDKLRGVPIDSQNRELTEEELTMKVIKEALAADSEDELFDDDSDKSSKLSSDEPMSEDDEKLFA